MDADAAADPPAAAAAASPDYEEEPSAAAAAESTSREDLLAAPSASGADSSGASGDRRLSRAEADNVDGAEQRLAAAVVNAKVADTEERKEQLREADRRVTATMSKEQRLAVARAQGAVPDEEAELRRGKLREAFGIFDSDKGGFIEMDELTSILNLVGLADGEEGADFASVGAQLGMDDEGKVGEAEFMACLEPYVYGAIPEDEETAESLPLRQLYEMVQRDEVAKLLDAFRACDADGSGDIDKEELNVVMTSLGENLSAKELDAMFAELDDDGGGSIDFDEFIRFMCRRNAGALNGKAKGAAKFFNVDALAQISSFMAEKNITEEESQATLDDMPFLEKLGAGYMKDYYRKKELRSQKKLTAGQAANVHILTKQNRKDMQRVERWSLFIDVMLGFVSAMVAGVAELFATKWWDTDGQSDLPGDQQDHFDRRVTYFWLFVGGISVAVTVVEIALIYYVHLKAAVRISRITGLKLFPIDKERAFVTAALARAALELPHPNTPEYGVNPLAEASKLKLAVAALAYKAKTGVSTFVVRLLLKRVLVRVALKSLLFFAAAPVQMIWNGIVGAVILRSTRIVALGPSVAVELSTGLLAGRAAELSKGMKEGVVRAIATVCVAKELMHPNLRILLQHTVRMMGMEEDMVAALPVQETDGMPLTSEQQAQQLADAELNRSQTDLSAALPPEAMLHLAVSSVDDAIPDEAAAIDEAAQGTAVESIELEDRADKQDGAGAGAADDAKESDAKEDDPGQSQIVADVINNSEDCFVPQPGNARRFLELVQALNPEEHRTDQGIEDQKFLLRFMVLAVVLDGFVSNKVITVWRALTRAVMLNDDHWVLRFLTFKFIRGELATADLDDLFDPMVRMKNSANSRSARCKFCIDRSIVACSC